MKDDERVTGLPAPALFLLRSPVIPEAGRLKQDHARAHSYLGTAFGQQGRTREAIKQFQEAVRLKADYADARRNLDVVLAARARSSSVPRGAPRRQQPLSWLAGSYPPATNSSQTRPAAREEQSDEMFDRW